MGMPGHARGRYIQDDAAFYRITSISCSVLVSIKSLLLAHSANSTELCCVAELNYVEINLSLDQATSVILVTLVLMRRLMWSRTGLFLKKYILISFRGKYDCLFVS